jgi:hypothetical protein
MMILEQHDGLIYQLACFDCCTDQELHQLLGSVRFESFRSNKTVFTTGLRPLQDTEPDGFGEGWIGLGKSEFEAIKPNELSLPIGILFLICLSGGAALLSYLKYKEIVLGGKLRLFRSLVCSVTGFITKPL